MQQRRTVGSLQKLVQRVFLGVEGLLGQFDNAPREIDVVNLFDQPDHGEIMFAADVNTDEERVLAIE